MPHNDPKNLETHGIIADSRPPHMVQISNLSEVSSAMVAMQVDAAVALSLTRAIIGTIGQASPELSRLLIERLGSEVERARSEGDLNDDPISRAVAAVLEHVLYEDQGVKTGKGFKA